VQRGWERVVVRYPLDVQLLSHLPGNAHIERFFRFLQGRVLEHNRARSLEELQTLIDRWVETYNAGYRSRDTVCTPAERLQPSATRPLEGSADDVFCLKDERKVAKDHTFSLAGATYTLPREPCLVAFKVQLHLHPGERLRVWHGGRLVAELPSVDKEQLRRDAPLRVEQTGEDILAAT